MSVNYLHSPLHPANSTGNSHRDPLSQQQQRAHPAQHPYAFPPQQPQSYITPPSPQQSTNDGEPQQQLATSSTNGNPNGSGDGQKGNRLRKACDSCSIRKVKCDESGPPCRACAALEIPCTFERPSRRRGPPNRHAEEIKRRRLESPAAFSSPASPNHVAATLASLSSHSIQTAESICPWSILELLVDDFFTYIHPLAPFPHEPSFRLAFRAREDLHNPTFLALLASMVGSLVASFPRKPRLHLKAQNRETLFPSSVSLVERCRKVALDARGTGYLDRELSVYDAATSYFLGLAAGYTFQYHLCRLYFGECLSISRSIGLHRTRDPNFHGLGSTAMGADGPAYMGQQGQPADYIKQEIGRRIFYVMIVGIRSTQQLGASFGELIIPPPSRNEPYPPLPMEVDDKYIFVDHVDPQPPGELSKMVGFNLGVKVYLTLTPLMTMELAYGVDEIFDWNRQRYVLGECLRAVKKALAGAPSQLLLTPGSQPGSFAQEHQYYSPTTDYPDMRGAAGNSVLQSKPMQEDRHSLAYEVQKANIYASQLGTRSYVVEKYWNLSEEYDRIKSNASEGAQSSPELKGAGSERLYNMGANQSNSPSDIDVIGIEMSNEREDIVKDLLRVLSSINQVNMEPNGSSFINKIRQIASTLLDTPRNRKGPLALRAEEYLSRFLDVLMQLERVSPGGSAGVEPEEDDEEELRHWADLREFQTKFAQSGGFLNQM